MRTRPRLRMRGFGTERPVPIDCSRSMAQELMSIRRKTLACSCTMQIWRTSLLAIVASLQGSFGSTRRRVDSVLGPSSRVLPKRDLARHGAINLGVLRTTSIPWIPLAPIGWVPACIQAHAVQLAQITFLTLIRIDDAISTVGCRSRIPSIGIVRLRNTLNLTKASAGSR